MRTAWLTTVVSTKDTDGRGNCSVPGGNGLKSPQAQTMRTGDATTQKDGHRSRTIVMDRLSYVRIADGHGDRADLKIPRYRQTMLKYVAIGRFDFRVENQFQLLAADADIHRLT